MTRLKKKLKLIQTLLISNIYVIFGNKNQNLAATSTNEVQYMVRYQTRKNIVFFSYCIYKFNFGYISNLLIQPLKNNSIILDLIKNSNHNSSTQNINVQYYYIQQVIAEGSLKKFYRQIQKITTYIATKLNKVNVISTI